MRRQEQLSNSVKLSSERKKNYKRKLNPSDIKLPLSYKIDDQLM
ncbi:hypothetical protein NE686_02685 [Tissierella carlieri]|uniref:Uncharacterized protein n=1 Tax=Tissierella carlieri TaxID=689904 RepID=A0ABT1S689_9FIRM|nr:hypothetical protein [Tissierella carlieri]MCQ4921980.1 hypothetical protein [Tissierella carlieri]